MSEKPELILGTAEFDPKGYGGKPPVDKKEIVRILNLAAEYGIAEIDLSPSYGCVELLDRIAKNFGWIMKVRDRPIEDFNGNVFYHYGLNEKPIQGIKSASVYTREQLVGLDKAIIPFNIAYTELLDYAPSIWYARSVFNRGRLLEEGYTVKDCLDFVKRHDPFGVIVGVCSVMELEDILKVW